MSGAFLPFVPFLALVIFAVQGLIISFFAVELTVPLGKKSAIAALAASVAVAAALGYFWTSALGTSMAFTILCSTLCAGGIAYRLQAYMAKTIAEQLKMASTVAKFALENFERLDFSAEGDFGAFHLEKALEEGGFSEGQQWLLRHMRTHLADIGHQAQVLSAPMAVPHGAGYVHVIYRVSRRDLQSYEGRLKAKYEAWI